MRPAEGRGCLGTVYCREGSAWERERRRAQPPTLPNRDLSSQLLGTIRRSEVGDGFVAIFEHPAMNPPPVGNGTSSLHEPGRSNDPGLFERLRHQSEPLRIRSRRKLDHATNVVGRHERLPGEQHGQEGAASLLNEGGVEQRTSGQRNGGHCRNLEGVTYGRAHRSPDNLSIALTDRLISVGMVSH